MPSQVQYRPIITACINPASFPSVALYVKSGPNFVLYKPAERPLTHQDLQRLEQNRAETLYIRSEEMGPVASFLEETIAEIMENEDLQPQVKGQILSQVAMNYVMDLFATPDKLTDIERCRHLVRQLMNFITQHPNAFDSLHAVVEHDYYTFVHSVQVASLSMLAHAEIFSLPLYELEDVGIGGILHDVGMIFIPNTILDKPDALTNFEYTMIKRHAQRGYECLRDLGGFSEISLAAVRFHHERYNGDGYPFNLKGDAIPRTAQITAICDVYSALTSNRPYRTAISNQDALTLMEREGRSIFNPNLLARFKQIVGDSPSEE
jgi:HD-GYP domain-containing protein (c-di-GMP phosphodiesterase class II)